MQLLYIQPQLNLACLDSQVQGSIGPKIDLTISPHFPANQPSVYKIFKTVNDKILNPLNYSDLHSSKLFATDTML